jgi:hypothetical protein
MAEDGRTDLPPLTMSCDSPHRKQPIQCGYCSSCILRKQALAASKIEDKTRYVVPDGDCPAADPSLHLRHMSAQVCTFRRLLSPSNKISLQWEEMTANFESLDDIIDRTAEAEGLSPAEMQSHLIRLYRTYVSEWETVESRIAADFL